MGVLVSTRQKHGGGLMQVAVTDRAHGAAAGTSSCGGRATVGSC